MKVDKMLHQVPQKPEFFASVRGYCKSKGLFDPSGIGFHRDFLFDFCPGIDEFKTWAEENDLSPDPYHPVAVEDESLSSYLFKLGFIGMVDYLKVCAMFPGEHVAMPSRFAQNMIDSWLRREPDALFQICKRVGLGVIPERLVEPVWGSHDEGEMKPILLSWIGACRMNAINPRRHKEVPNLFYIDTDAVGWNGRRNYFSRYNGMGLKLEFEGLTTIVPACSPANLLRAGNMLNLPKYPYVCYTLIKNFSALAQGG